MNGLLRLKKDMPVVGLTNFRHILYFTLLSSISSEVYEDTKFVFSNLTEEDVYDYFSDWDTDEVHDALKTLGEEGLVEFSEGKIYLGEFRGKRFFPYEAKSSMFEMIREFLFDKLSVYSKTARNKSRAKYIMKEVKNLSEKVDKLTPSDFTELHGLLYEVYTGGEVYNVRNQVEYYQTSNILKVYDRHTTFCIITEGTLNYEAYRKSGIPTLTFVGVSKDDIFGNLAKGTSHGKDYMRSVEDVIDSGTF